eukprot:scaffold26766_cov166-Cylindrotheca_fusiformis.AAC.1
MLSPDDEMDEMCPDALRMDLESLLEDGDRLRLERRRELLRLRSELEPLSQSYKSKVATTGNDLALYQQAIVESFQEEEQEQAAPYVQKIQAQLCSALHNQELLQTQIRLAQHSNKRLIVYLSKQIELLKEENQVRSDTLSSEIARGEAANRLMRDMFDKDASDQEDEMKALKVKLGMDPNNNNLNDDVKPRRFAVPRRGIQRLSGSIRNIVTTRH